LSDLYLDHNVSHGLVPLLLVSGHHTLTSRDISSERLPDDAQLLFAVRARRILVTHNRDDFRMLHDAWVSWPAAFGVALPPHPGILVLDTGSAEALAPVIISFLDETPTDRLANAVFWWRRHAGWQQAVAGAAWEPYQPLRDAAEK
jgi:hypothetical protein